MANCLKCAHAKEIDRLRKVCLECSIGGEGCGLSHKGRSHISLDAAASEHNRDEILSRAEVRVSPKVTETPLSADERSRYLTILNMFSALSYDEAGLVCSMLGGKTIAEIASERKEAIQTVHARWKSLTRRQPAFVALANGLIGSGCGRRGEVKTRQIEFAL